MTSATHDANGTPAAVNYEMCILAAVENRKNLAATVMPSRLLWIEVHRASPRMFIARHREWLRSAANWRRPLP